MKDITNTVFQYVYYQMATSNSKIAQRVWDWLQKDYNQFYDDGFVMIIEGNMPNYAYDYLNRHSSKILNSLKIRFVITTSGVRQV